MAETRREGQEAERPGEGERSDAAAASARERSGNPVQQQGERLAKLGSAQMRQTAEASAAATEGALRSGSAAAGDTQEITAAWARYAEQVMRHTSEASQALLRARSFNEMLEVQAKLLRDNMQAFLDQTVTIAEAAGRMATRPLQALKEASTEQTRR